MADVSVNIQDNVEDVIEDIERKVKGELRRMVASIEAILDIVRSDAKRYVKQDAELSGQLRQSIKMSRTKLSTGKTRLKVGVRGSMAPYAAIVELGTGNKTLETTEKASSQSVPNRKMDNPPKDFPFSSPNIEPDRRNATFLGFVGHIEDWMREKGIKPEKPSYRASAMAIAHEIVTEGSYAHPYLRPAYFEHELEIRQVARQVVRDAAK